MPLTGKSLKFAELARRLHFNDDRTPAPATSSSVHGTRHACSLLVCVKCHKRVVARHTDRHGGVLPLAIAQLAAVPPACTDDWGVVTCQRGVIPSTVQAGRPAHVHGMQWQGSLQVVGSTMPQHERAHPSTRRCIQQVCRLVQQRALVRQAPHRS